MLRPIVCFVGGRNKVMQKYVHENIFECGFFAAFARLGNCKTAYTNAYWLLDCSLITASVILLADEL